MYQYNNISVYQFLGIIVLISYYINYYVLVYQFNTKYIKTYSFFIER
ncbi:LOW QUALITY PROTEIN: hypothetical protein PanWU01x14_224990 [Parasponia andersonii]|uniref:Uncharacterized protein n=1 Tax=Parasponia andersonii TaxID=3476 RepID=A0A2P5BN12_PARAD|nr:LOW QUALITY PROTEIN: hypothetical protein PanWU01x14_224990 [Parasponia andersonii]